MVNPRARIRKRRETGPVPGDRSTPTALTVTGTEAVRPGLSSRWPCRSALPAGDPAEAAARRRTGRPRRSGMDATKMPSRAQVDAVLEGVKPGPDEVNGLPRAVAGLRGFRW